MYRLAKVGGIKMPWYPWIVGWYLASKGLHDHPLVIAKAEELGVSPQH